MTERQFQIKKLLPILARALGMVLGLLLIVSLMLWMTGATRRKIPPGSRPPAVPVAYRGPSAVAHIIAVPKNIRAVGTISPIEPVVLTPRIVGRIIFSRLFAGTTVHKGQILVRLDDAQLQAQLAQAVAAIRLARAQLRQALIDQKRDKKLLATGDVTVESMDLANTAVASDQANLARALAGERTAQTVLGYATIRSTINGIVMQKFVNVGDTVMPGQMLAKIYDPRQLQLAAVVRESLAADLRLGQKLLVHLEGFHTTVPTHIRQIVPRVSAQSRTFIVKAASDFPAGVWPGMYGNLIIPTGIEKILVIPNSAIEHIGQLDLVTIVRHGQLIRQTVQPGRHLGAWREILSGVVAGQRVTLPATGSQISNLKAPIAKSGCAINPALANLESRIPNSRFQLSNPESQISNFKSQMNNAIIGEVRS
ncbi:MAG: efflux RND transporter periplasmic adaptor subunit [Phycisphaerae bacterium]